MKKQLLSILALLLMTATGAWAQTETLLITIESTGDNQYFRADSKTFGNIATITFEQSVKNDNDEWGWYYNVVNSFTTMTVTAAEGYTITRCKFYTKEGSGEDTQSPFEAILDEGGEDIYNAYTKVNGSSIGHYGVTKVEVYGYASGETTGINTVAKEQSTDNTYYDLQGRRVKQATKGLYIINGKKVLVGNKQ